MQRFCVNTALEREPVNAGGVEPVHGRPTISPFTNVGGHALLARDPDQDRHEAMIAVTMHRRREPDGCCPHAAFHQRGRRGLRFAGISGRVERRHVLFSRGAARGQECHAGGHEQRTVGAFERGAEHLDGASVLRAVFHEFGEVVIEGSVDHAVGLRRAALEAV